MTVVLIKFELKTFFFIKFKAQILIYNIWSEYLKLRPFYANSNAYIP